MTALETGWFFLAHFSIFSMIQAAIAGCFFHTQNGPGHGVKLRLSYEKQPRKKRMERKEKDEKRRPENNGTAR